MTKILNKKCERRVLFTPGEKRDPFSAIIPPGELFDSSRLTILSARPHSKAKIISQPPPGKTGNAEIVIKWQSPRYSMVTYQIEAFSRPDTQPEGTEPSVTRQMTRFLPSEDGFLFKNKFPAPTPTYINIFDKRIEVGDASKGLCGGMVFSALDYFYAGMPIPTVKNLPGDKKLHDYVFKRLLHSFDLPFGPLNYIELMHPKYPDGRRSRGIFGVIPVIPEGRAWRMIRVEWPKIKMKLDAGTPCPLGLVLIKSTDLKRLGENHQVLAYGYELIKNELTLYIYDPNRPKDDNITLRLNIGNPERATKVSYSHRENTYCFFMENYTFSIPLGKKTFPGRILLFEDRNFDGKSIDVIKGVPDLSVCKEGNFDECTSSFVILSGDWCFYQNPRYKNPFEHGRRPLVFGPGSYGWVEDLGIKDNEISSLKVMRASNN